VPLDVAPGVVADDPAIADPALERADVAVLRRSAAQLDLEGIDGRGIVLRLVLFLLPDRVSRWMFRVAHVSRLSTFSSSSFPQPAWCDVSCRKVRNRESGCPRRFRLKIITWYGTKTESGTSSGVCSMGT